MLLNPIHDSSLTLTGPTTPKVKATLAAMLPPHIFMHAALQACPNAARDCVICAADCKRLPEQDIMLNT